MKHPYKFMGPSILTQLLIILLFVASFIPLLSGQELYAKPVSIGIDDESRVWHSYQVWTQDGKVHEARLIPGHWMIGTTVWARPVDGAPNGGMYQQALEPGEKLVQLMVGQPWPKADAELLYPSIATPIVYGTGEGIPDVYLVHDKVRNRTLYMVWDTKSAGWLYVGQPIRVIKTNVSRIGTDPHEPQNNYYIPGTHGFEVIVLDSLHLE